MSLHRLSFGTKEFKYQLDENFFNEIEASEVHRAEVAATLQVAHEHEGIFELDFAFKGTLWIPCDRCLDDMSMDVDTTWHLTVKEGDRYDDSVDDVLTVPQNWRELDLQPLMRDTVLLTIPIMHVHPEGSCNSEMMEQLSNHSAIDLADDEAMREAAADSAESVDTDDNNKEADPRWDALKKLLDKN